MTTETISKVFTAIIDANNRITITQAIRIELDIQAGDILELEIQKIVKKDKETKSSE